MSADVDLFGEYLRRKSAAAFRGLAQSRRAEIYTICFQTVPDRQLAEDAAQEVLLLLLARAESIDPEYLTGWLVSTARLVAKAIRRKHASQSALESRPHPHPHPESSDDDPAENPERLAALAEGMAQIPPDARKLIQRHYLEGASHAQLAREIGLTRAAARKRLSRAVAQLRASPAVRTLDHRAD